MENHLSGCNGGIGCVCEEKSYWAVLVLGAGIALMEFVGGFLSGSLALLSDAFHVVADTGSNGVSLFVAYAVRKNLWEERKLRAVSGYAGALFLGFAAIWIFLEALERIFFPNEISAWSVVAIALLGAYLNYRQHRMLVATHRSHVTHESMRFHVHSDLVQSLLVAAAGVTIALTGERIVDPLFSVAVAVYMFFLTIRLSRRSKATWDGLRS